MSQTPPNSEQYSDLSVRFITAIVLAAIALFALYQGGGILAIFMGAMSALMVAELTAIAFKDREASRLARLSFVGCGAYAGTAGALYPPMGIVMTLAGLGLAMLAGRHLLTRSAVLGFALICLATISLGHLRLLPGGFWVVIWVICCVVAADTGAYFSGRRFGGKKLWPAVSPKKTWSGFWGGFALAVIVSGAFALSMGAPLLPLLLLGGLIAVVSVAGDLTESAFKRRNDVKDAGGMLPGHGGLLDRFDGLIAAALFVGALSLIADMPNLLNAYHTSGSR